MLRGFYVASVVLLLAGCAHAPPPQMMVTPHKAPIIKQAPAPVAVAPVTPNQVVKKRFWDKFPKHPKFFH